MDIKPPIVGLINMDTGTKLKEKKKWQIALRRYVIEKSLSKSYASYFGLDIQNMRLWFECQFKGGIEWGNFGKQWQFEHVVPVSCFDFTKDEDLKLCWNFVNIKVDRIVKERETIGKVDMVTAKRYFKRLYEQTDYEICKEMLDKIEIMEQQTTINTQPQQDFINMHKEYLQQVKTYASFEFELLNMGKTIAEVNKQMDIIRKFGS
jgi:hypothetical protein